MTGGSASGSPAGDGAVRKPRSTRGIDTLTALLLALSCFWVLIAAAPSLLRAATGAGMLEEMPADGLFHEPEYRPRLQAGGSDESPGRERDIFGEPRQHGTVEGADPPGEAEDDGEIPLGSLRLGVAKEHLTLWDRPGPDASARGELNAGDTVVIIREVDDWALIHATGSAAGWVRRAQVSTGGDSPE